jgi:hypothetical protein
MTHSNRTVSASVTALELSFGAGLLLVAGASCSPDQVYVGGRSDDAGSSMTGGSAPGGSGGSGDAGQGGIGGTGGTDGNGGANTGGAAGSGGTVSTPGTGVPDGPGSGRCDLKQATFCETLDKPSPGGRSGDLDETLWSVARVNQKVNSGQGELVSWPEVPRSACGEVMDVFPYDDMIVCTHPTTGRPELTSAFDDAEGPVFHSMRVIQPFDFEGRVGHISIDIDAKTQTPGGHGWWWELVIADEPVPVPYQEFISHALMGRKAVVLEFEGISSFDGTSNELSHVFVEDGYEYAHEFTRDQADYVAFQTEEEVLNHLEILINKDFLEVWATDLDDVSTFRRVARIDGLGLTFTRGYVNIQHSQYNAAKSGDLDRFVTYHIGSLGFDGPELPRPRSYQVPDALAAGRTSNVKNLGYQLAESGAGTPESFTLDGVDLTDASEARINLNAWYFTSDRSIEFRFNGGEWRTFAHPFPESTPATRAVTMPVELGDLTSGQNTLELRTGGGSTELPMVIANVELEVVPR